MSGQTPPWLEDLSEDWVPPSEPIRLQTAVDSGAPSLKSNNNNKNSNSNNNNNNNNIIINNNNNNNINNSSRSRLPRRSSGSFARDSDAITFSQKRRTPLADLSNSDANAAALDRPGDSKLPVLRSTSAASSIASVTSVVRYETVARKSKSSSPEKTQDHFEWRKRLLDGDVGYGDQTDLFGPSGLENIFTSPAKQAEPVANHSPRHRNMFRQQDFPPSSPPPYPSSIDFSAASTPPQQGTPRRCSLDSVAEEHEYDDQDTLEDDVSAAQHTPGQGLLHPSACNNPGDRTFSGQTDLSGEHFSPVFLAKHTTVDGKIDYATIDSRRLDHSHESSPFQHSDRRDLSEAISPRTQLPASQPAHLFSPDDTMPSVPEVSLPDNLPTGTPPIASLGDFVTTKRGGLSTYGSFNQRPLSPSQSQQSASLQTHVRDFEPSMHDSLQPNPHLRPTTPPKHPATPRLKEESVSLSPPKTRPSTSPLKLFGNYDTFTNNRLLRRMSQLEDLNQEESQQSELGANHDCADSHRPTSSIPTISSDYPGGTQGPEAYIRPSLGSFGEGELDDHDFEADLSIPSTLNFSQADFSDDQGSPPPHAFPPGSRTPFRFHVDESLDDHLDSHDHPSFQLKRKLSKRSTARSRISDEFGSRKHKSFLDEQSFLEQHLDGKRPRSSPIKSPTAKRRRTLGTNDGDIPDVGIGSQIQLMITGASTDGSRSTSLSTYNSWKKGKTIALRPRNPTPSQTSREQIQAEVGEATMDFLTSSPGLEAIKESLELSDIPGAPFRAEKAKAVAAEVAAFTLNVSKNASDDGKRNRSITTQDFLDEAMHIMSLIRARGRPRSGLSSVMEPDAEDSFGQHLHPDDLPRSPSPIRLSRPPSREGVSTGWRPRSQTQHDPRIVSQLRKFRETDDELEVIESSVRSLSIKDLEEHNAQVLAADAVSNVRIMGPRPETGRNRRHSQVSQKGSNTPSKTHGSNPSLDSSGSRTVVTQASHRSDNVATLAPETVAHLIPEQVAGMTFDKELQRWVRIKSSKRIRPEELEPTSALPTPSNVTSDDDPFNDIPDLTVDEVKELTRIGMSPTKEFLAGKPVDLQDGRINSNETVLARPVTRENQVAPPFTSSSAPSKWSSAFGSSQQQQIDTRATSWSQEAFAAMRRSKLQASQTGYGLHDLAHINMPHPISDIPEHAEEESYIENVYDEETLEEDESLPLQDSETEEIPVPKQRGTVQNQPWMQSSPASMYRGMPRAYSLRRQTLTRPMFATAQDQSEMSFVAELPDKRLMSVSVNVSKPIQRSARAGRELVLPSSSPAKIDGTFYLSDLPDFTVNEDDAERPSERALARRIAQHAATDRYAFAVQNLVKTLTDVEPDEPYWEDIKQLGLSNKNLGSVHNLEDFCGRVEDLDLSRNNIAHLEGAPSSIRRLNVRSNCLSSLTAWSHLMNLQYLDISSNSVDSLAGLCMLVHLREVRADDNQISSLDGILGLDGLLKLSVRGNRLTEVDFEGSQLKRLEELNLADNEITSVLHIDDLPSLSRLVLDGNLLGSFPRTNIDSALSSLSLQSNRLDHLDASRYPNLRYLNVDGNRLHTIQGIQKLRRLDTLSMRKQTLVESSRIISILEQQIHVRSLYLSSNAISILELPHIHNSVQNLELASCGLQDLPIEFGLRFPNLRSLNISFNALKDLRPLLNIPRLETLHVAGNRIARLRKTVAVLARMQQLHVFDGRENPFTLGFYPPSGTIATTQTSSEQSLVISSSPSASASFDFDSESDTDIQRRLVKSYILSASNIPTDAEHVAHLDEDTKLRRRVYELLLSGSCKGLARLDGVVFDRANVKVRDEAWERLVELGIMKKSDCSLLPCSSSSPLLVEGSASSPDTETEAVKSPVDAGKTKLKSRLPTPVYELGM